MIHGPMTVKNYQGRKGIASGKAIIELFMKLLTINLL